MKYAAAAFVLLAAAIYGLDRGIYVGSEDRLLGHDSNPLGDHVQKVCRHLFITGLSEAAAVDGKVSAPSARSSAQALKAAMESRNNGYCHIFGDRHVR